MTSTLKRIALAFGDPQPPKQWRGTREYWESDEVITVIAAPYGISGDTPITFNLTTFGLT